MKNSKLLDLIKHIKQEEVRSYLKFLRSPFYSSNEMPEKLFLYIYQYYPGYGSPRLSRELAFNKLFPNEKYHPQKMRKLMHELKILTEEYMAVTQLRNDELQKKKMLQAAFDQRNMYTHFKEGVYKLRDELEALPWRDISVFDELHHVELAFYENPETSKGKENISMLKSALNNLDFYYLLQRQRLGFALRWVAKLLAVNEPLRLRQQNEVELQTIPAYKMYTLLNEVIARPDNPPYDDSVEKAFFANSHQLSKKDQLEILMILINQLTHQFNKGEKALSSKIFALYKFGLEQNIFFYNKQMDQASFTNIVTIGMLEQEYTWAEAFIAEYGFHLPDNVREDTICMSQAMLCLYQKEYHQTIELLLNHSFREVFLILKSKGILVRAYFELFTQDASYFDVLVAQIEAFEKYVRRNQLIAKSKKVTYLGFLSFLRKMSNQYQANNLKASLYHQIKNSQSIILKDWLLNQHERLSS